MGRVIRNYFDMLCSNNFNHNQLKFFNFLKDNLHDVPEIKSYETCFDRLSIPVEIIRLLRLQPRQCYSNAANVCIFGSNLNKLPINYEILYCEGYVTTNDIVHEHAWNCVINRFTGEKTYFDITFEYVLNYDLQTINTSEYCVVYEYTLNNLNQLRLSTMCTGPYLVEIFQEQNK